MSSDQNPSLEQLKIIYQEIIEGVSVSTDGLFFRHFTELDHITVMRQRMTFYERYIKDGIPTEAERLKTIIANEEWSHQKEDDILSLKLSISDNEKNILSVIAPQQPSIRKAIDIDKKKLIDLLLERANTLGTTAEEMAYRDTSLFSVYLSTYQDKRLTQPLFDSWETMEEEEYTRLDALHDSYDKTLAKFIEKNIRLVAVLPFFLNIFSYSKDNIALFLNKPLIQLTSYQSFLFSCGQRNLNILSQAEGSPPDLIGDIQANKILDWYDQQFSIILGKRNSSK